MTTPIEVWRDSGGDIMICVRVPGGGETVYMGGTKGAADDVSIGHAMRWLEGLSNGGIDERSVFVVGERSGE